MTEDVQTTTIKNNTPWHYNQVRSGLQNLSSQQNGMIMSAQRKAKEY